MEGIDGMSSAKKVILEETEEEENKREERLGEAIELKRMTQTMEEESRSNLIASLINNPNQEKRDYIYRISVKIDELLHAISEVRCGTRSETVNEILLQIVTDEEIVTKLFNEGIDIAEIFEGEAPSQEPFSKSQKK